MAPQSMKMGQIAKLNYEITWMTIKVPAPFSSSKSPRSRGRPGIDPLHGKKPQSMKMCQMVKQNLLRYYKMGRSDS